MPSLPLVQVRALARFRWLRLKHRLVDVGLAERAVAALVGVVVVVGAGALLVPDRIGPERAGGGVTHWGGWPLESAFYLGCLLALVQSFRILEAFFRHDDARFLATFPIRLRALFAYRLGSALLGTSALAAGALLFLAPVAWRGAWAHFAASAVLLGVAVLLVVGVGFAAQMAAGVANYKRLPGFFTELDERSTGPGGHAAAFIFAPALAMGVSLFLLLFAKLALEEVFRDQAQTGEWALPGITRATGVIIGATVAGCLLWSYRNFTRHFPRLFARFFEADLVVADVGYDYFARDRRPPRGLEARLPGRTRALYRLDRLQLARRSPLARMMVVAGPLVALVVFGAFGHRLAPWMVTAAGLFWVVVLANPVGRLLHPSLEPGQGKLFPVEPGLRRRARLALLVRELLVLALPIGLAGAVLGDLAGISAALVVTPLALASLPLALRAGRRNHRAPMAVGALLAALGGGLTALGAWGPWAGAAVLFVLAAPLWRRELL